MPFYKTNQIIGSIGLKSNRSIHTTATATKVKVRKPSASKLKAMGYTANQRQTILNAWA